jgi:hypothetical protein
MAQLSAHAAVYQGRRITEAARQSALPDRSSVAGRGTTLAHNDHEDESPSPARPMSDITSYGSDARAAAARNNNNNNNNNNTITWDGTSSPPINARRPSRTSSSSAALGPPSAALPLRTSSLAQNNNNIARCTLEAGVSSSAQAVPSKASVPRSSSDVAGAASTAGRSSRG